MNGKELNEIFLKNRNEIEKIGENQKIFVDGKRQEQQKIHYSYLEKIQDLQAEKNTKENAIDEIIKEREEKDKIARNELKQVITEAKKIIYLLTIDKNIKSHPINFDETKVKPYANNKLELIDRYQDNQLLKLGVYVTTNKKPTNKYDLVILGFSRIGDKSYNLDIARDTLKIPSIGSIWLNIGEMAKNLEIVVKSFATINEAKAYYQSKGLKKILQEFFVDFEKIKQDLEQIKQNFKLSDLTPIINNLGMKSFSDISAYSRENHARELGLLSDNVNEMTDKEKNILGEWYLKNLEDGKYD